MAGRDSQLLNQADSQLAMTGQSKRTSGAKAGVTSSAMGATTNLVNQSRLAVPISTTCKGTSLQTTTGMKALNLNQTQPLQLLQLDNEDPATAEHADLLRLKSAALE